jgi:hypothetical protein
MHHDGACGAIDQPPVVETSRMAWNSDAQYEGYACDEASLFTVCCLDDGKRTQTGDE